MGYIENIFEKAKKRQNIETIARLVSPHGEKRGQEWISFNPNRVARRLGSFSINLKTGKWADFAQNIVGGDIISYYGYVKNLNNLQAAREILNEPERNNFSPKIENPIEKQEKNKDYINKLLEESYPLTKNTVGIKYLRNRKIFLKPPDSIRYHPNLKHFSGSYHPALLSKVTKIENNDIIALHRTYLTREGEKAPIEPNKMLISSPKKGGVLLTEKNKKFDRIYLTEGIETGLSLKELLQMKNTKNYIIIAILSTTNLKHIKFKKDWIRNKTIYITMDNDNAGKKAAKEKETSLLREGISCKNFQLKSFNDYNELLIKIRQELTIY